MADPAQTARKLLLRVRELGANLDLIGEGDRFRIVNERRLPQAARTMIAEYASELATVLRREADDQQSDIEERAAIIEFDGKTPRDWAWQFAEILIARRPTGMSDTDWSWFITRCGQIIDAGSERASA